MTVTKIKYWIYFILINVCNINVKTLKYSIYHPAMTFNLDLMILAMVEERSMVTSYTWACVYCG